MGCNCGAGRKARAAIASGNPIMGYRAFVPDGSGGTNTVPPANEPPFHDKSSAFAEVRLAGGGTVKTVYANG